MAVIAIHPGEHLAEELKTLGMSAAELARNLGVPTNRITQILNGQRAITGDTALRLAHFFGTTPEFWLNLQNLYELRLAQRRAGSAIRSLPNLKSVNNTIRLKNRRAAAEFGEDQGKVVSRGVRRTR
jgi:addiction module HigA family antidote